MREMKDSGIEWVGKVPKIWSLNPIRALFDEVTEKNFLGTCSNALKFTYGSIVRKPNFDADADDYVASTILNYTVVEPGTIMLNGLNLNFDFVSQRIGLVKEKGVITSAYMAFKPNEKHLIDSEFATYLFKAYDGCKAFHNMGGGVRKILNFNEFKKYYIPLPDLNEQHHIVDYLDTKCSEIDATAEDIQKEISLLEDYKKSVITEAVTKGLNPDAEMKDSGIEWIGDINRKASLCRLKFFSYMKGRIGWQGLKSEDFIDNGPYCVTGTDFINGKINWDTCYHVSEERYKMDSNIQLKIGDLLVTKDGTIGKLAKVTELPEKACLNSHLLIIRPLNERFTNEYLYYVISSDVFVRYYKYSSTGSTMESLSQEKLGNFIFPVYDLLSQQQIVDYLDSKCSEIETLIADKKRQLDILADYKKSLIYEYVTGKKEVPVKDF